MCGGGGGGGGGERRAKLYFIKNFNLVGINILNTSIKYYDDYGCNVKI